MKIVQILTPNFSDISASNKFGLKSGEKITFIQILIGKIESDFQFFASLPEGAKLNVQAAIIARDSCKFKYNYHVEHFGVNSESNFNLISSLSGNSQKETEMLIHFNRGAIGAVGVEKESVILSDRAKNVSYPIINSDEEKINGSHSLSSGHIDTLQLQYLRTRGLSETEARNMITRAKILSILNLIDDDDKLKYIQEALNEQR